MPSTCAIGSPSLGVDTYFHLHVFESLSGINKSDMRRPELVGDRDVGFRVGVVNAHDRNQNTQQGFLDDFMRKYLDEIRQLSTRCWLGWGVCSESLLFERLKSRT